MCRAPAEEIRFTNVATSPLTPGMYGCHRTVTMTPALAKVSMVRRRTEGPGERGSRIADRCSSVVLKENCTTTARIDRRRRRNDVSTSALDLVLITVGYSIRARYLSTSNAAWEPSLTGWKGSLIPPKWTGVRRRMNCRRNPVAAPRSPEVDSEKRRLIDLGSA